MASKFVSVNDTYKLAKSKLCRTATTFVGATQCFVEVAGKLFHPTYSRHFPIMHLAWQCHARLLHARWSSLHTKIKPKETKIDEDNQEEETYLSEAWRYFRTELENTLIGADTSKFNLDRSWAKLQATLPPTLAHLAGSLRQRTVF